MDKALIIANLKRVIELVEQHDETLFNLDTFVDKTSCGTLYCTAGLIASQPEFQAQGWTLIRSRWNEYVPHINGLDIRGGDAPADTYFGPNALGALFGAVEDSRFDAEFLDEQDLEAVDEGYRVPENLHKPLALHRLRKQLALVESLP